ncbi:hypothetical protein PQA65_gp16 [Yersinia phage vB_YenM_42.18]|uniref:Uncharacterized protein n=1 Tax=Yersinia phage vB_YenM_42.18 TaxID=2918926 RepID=A0AAE9FSB8_9CAUD|nr:hypothetical protein PQA65_gp16 [Yersinia phage vB_YenM_42.18]UNA05730.1 hypothetical protein vBYenM4218_016 [Yersinia phage vB_YenM_42.18]
MKIPIVIKISKNTITNKKLTCIILFQLEHIVVHKGC